MRNQNFSKLNITSYILNLEEFSYYWYYCLLDNDRRRDRVYKASKRKRKLISQLNKIKWKFKIGSRFDNREKWDINSDF